jgi:hypothetical protein
MMLTRTYIFFHQSTSYHALSTGLPPLTPEEVAALRRSINRIDEAYQRRDTSTKEPAR